MKTTSTLVLARTKRRSFFGGVILLLSLATSLRAATFNWDGEGTNDLWSNANNWNPNGTPPNDSTLITEIVFNNSTRLTPFVNPAAPATSWSIHSLTFGPSAGPFTIRGNLLNIGFGGVTNNDAGGQIVENDINVRFANTPFNAAAGDLTIGWSLDARTLSGSTFFAGVLVDGSFDTTIYSNIVSSPGGLTKNGTGTLSLEHPFGTPAYTQNFTGPTTVNAGTLILDQNNTAGTIGGTLLIGDGTGVDLVRLDRSDQISGAVTVSSSGVFNLNGNNESLVSLTVNGGSVMTGTGVLTLQGALSSSGGAPGTIAGNLNLNNVAHTFSIGDGVATNDLDISAAISNGGFTKTNAGTLRLSGATANTYTGTTAVNDGVLALGKSVVNGAVLGDLVIGDSTGIAESTVTRLLASNQIDDALGDTVTINSDGLFDLGTFTETVREVVMTGGRISAGTGGRLDLVGAFTSSGNTTIQVSNLGLLAGTHTFSIANGTQAVDVSIGAISEPAGAASLTKSGAGTLRFSGATANTYTGTTTVTDGALVLEKIVGGSVRGPLVIGDNVGIANSAVVRLDFSSQVDENVGDTVTINSDGRLDLNGNVDTLRDIVMTGGNITNSTTTVLTLLGSLTTNASATSATITTNLALPGSHTFAVANGTAATDLNITSVISGPSSITKTGPGALALSGANTFSGGFTLNGGGLQLGHNTAVGSGPLVLQNGNVQASGAARDLANPVSLTGPVTFDGTLNLTFSGAVSGSGDLTKNDTGTLTFSAATTTLDGDVLLNTGGFTTGTLIIADPGTFTEAGGTYTGALTNRGVFTHNAGAFDGPLTNENDAIFNGAFSTGGAVTNSGSISVPATGTLTANGPGLSNTAAIALSGGTLAGTGPLINNGSLTGFGILAGSGGLTNQSILHPVGGNLTLTNSGTNTNTGTIDIDLGRSLILNVALTNSGSITLVAGNISGTGTVTNTAPGIISRLGNISVPVVNQSGATLSAQGGVMNIATVTNAGRITVASASTLAGGTITSSGRIEGGGTIGSTINNSGTIEPLAGATLTLTGTLTNAAAGMISLPSGTTLQNLSGFTVNDGIISLAGATFTKTGALTNNGLITGRGTIQTGGLTNEGTLEFTAGTTTIDGDVINNDTVTTTNATITFNGTYTENGTLQSDLSDHFFATLNVGITGKINADVGDRFFINGNFSNGSEQPSKWDTTAAELVFQSGPSHTFALAAVDLDASYDGYTDNFAWGTLRLQIGQSLSLSDGNATDGAAFYASAVILAGGTAQIPSITGNGFNIYYDAANSANAYLANRSYPLTGGGSLIPVPEPSGVLLLALGAGLTFFPNRRMTRGRCLCVLGK